jgi:endoglucanase
MRRISTGLAALLVGLASLLSAPTAGAADVANDAADVVDVVADAADADRHRPGLYVPEANPAAYRQAFELASAGQLRDVAGILTMAHTPQAVWYGDQTPVQVERQIREVARDADQDDALPVFALYNVPGRDCSNYSGGGASNTAEYKAWIDAIARGIGSRDALVVLEPDSLALVPADCGQDDAQGTLTAARYRDSFAVHRGSPRW